LSKPRDDDDDESCSVVSYAVEWMSISIESLTAVNPSLTQIRCIRCSYRIQTCEVLWSWKAIYRHCPHTVVNEPRKPPHWVIAPAGSFRGHNCV